MPMVVVLGDYPCLYSMEEHQPLAYGFACFAMTCNKFLQAYKDSFEEKLVAEVWEEQQSGLV